MSTRPPPADVVGRLLRLVPALDSLRGYRVADLRADLVAGLTVAAVAVPQAMAYAMIVGLPVEHGIYTAIVMTFVGALFDSSRQLINGPTNAISIAVLGVLAPLADPNDYVAWAILLAFLVGAIQLGISLLRLGDLTRYVSHSVIVGFTTGASLLLVLDQVKNLFGFPAQGGPHDHFIERFYLTLVGADAIHTATCAIGLGSIVVVIALRWLKMRVGLTLLPDLLLVVVGAALLVRHFGLDEAGVKVVGHIPAQLPSFVPPDFDVERVRALSSGALAIALLGLLEAVAMAKAIAAQTRQRLDMNQQCLSEAVANLAGSFFQCYPGSGSLTRSAINQQAGASTQWAGAFSALAVALTAFLLAPYARFVPRAALAGILVVSAFRMVDWHGLRYHVRATRFDTVLVVATAISAVAISIEFCVLIGVLLSFLLAVPRVSQVLLTEFVVTPEGGVHERLPDDPPCPKILIFGLEGELFFGAATSLEQHLQAIESRVQPDTRVVVLRMKRARNPDAVGLTLLEGFIDRIHSRGVEVLMCGVRPELRARLDKAGLSERLREGHLFLEQPVRQTSTLLAVRYAYELIDAPCATCPRKGGRDQDLYYAV